MDATADASGVSFIIAIVTVKFPPCCCRCKEDTYVDRLRNDVDMNHDLTNAESICSNCNFGKSGAELAMYDFKKNIDDGRVTVLRAVEAIVGGECDASCVDTCTHQHTRTHRTTHTHT